MKFLINELTIPCPLLQVATLVQRTSTRFDDTLRLNLHEDHFSYIKQFDMYAKSYQCHTCGKLWKSAWLMQRHERTCSVETNYKYPGGVFHLPPTIFQRLRDEGIDVEDRVFPYRATYDFECYFDKTELPRDSAKVTWEQQHIPLSVSVASNIPGYTEPRCFVTAGDTQELIDSMMSYVDEIAVASYELMLEQYEPVLEQLHTTIDEATVRDPVGRGEHPLQKLSEQLDSYLKVLPLVGFNSSNYDMNAIKTPLMTYLHRHSTIKYTVKRNNTFMSLETERVRFLDITNFIAPGYSYAKYLKAFQCEQDKGHFPYEWITPERLQDTRLPPHHAFHSSLKDTNITAEEYAYCQRVWEENEMKTCRDFLVWYNNLDVKPFLQAIERQSRFYSDR